jgi:2-keto-4-pentenoate hydratase/2-oxohepta-3-ene-1,7-dioic acid hydratase in catechol pathway
MKLASFNVDGRTSYGTVIEGRVREPGTGFKTQYPDLRAVIAAGAESELSRDRGGVDHGLAAIQLLSPIPNLDKILCVGVNYRPHIEEMGRSIPDQPVVFVRFPGSLVGHGDAVLRPRVSTQLDFEGELALVIGRRARHVSRDDAYNVIAGDCCFMDGSVRDWQRHTTQFTAGKNFARSGSAGPWVVTKDELADVSATELTTRVNGEVMQNGRVSELVFDIPALIEYCSTFTELLPGDLIATGTPGGVGAARTPPQWLEDGDLVEVDISGIGTLGNRVRDEA